MSRNNKGRRKEKQQKQGRKDLAARRSRTPRWLDVCDRAAGLLDRRLLDEAREVQAEQDCRRANPADGGYDEDQ